MHPVLERYLLDLMTEAEIEELNEYASADSPTPELYTERAHEWLRRRFPDRPMSLECTMEDGVFHIRTL